MLCARREVHTSASPCGEQCLNPNTAGNVRLYAGRNTWRPEMTPRTANAMDAIRFGIQLERDAVAAYEAAQKNAVTERCRDLFARLVEFENGHLHYLSSLYDELEGSGSWIAYHRVRGKEPPPPPSEANRELLPDITEQALRRERAALTAAIEHERKAHDFFKRAAEEAEDPAGHATFQFLAQEEEDHMRWLQRELDALPD